MAEHTSSGAHTGGMQEHERTYEAFLKGAVALTLISVIVLIALVSFAFAHTLPTFMGFAGLLVGALIVAIDARTGGRWYLSIGYVILYALITAINVG